MWGMFVVGWLTHEDHVVCFEDKTFAFEKSFCLLRPPSGWVRNMLLTELEAK